MVSTIMKFLDSGPSKATDGSLKARVLASEPDNAEGIHNFAPLGTFYDIFRVGTILKGMESKFTSERSFLVNSVFTNTLFLHMVCVSESDVTRVCSCTSKFRKAFLFILACIAYSYE